MKDSLRVVTFKVLFTVLPKRERDKIQQHGF